VRYVSHAGARVSVVGVGTLQFASRHWGYGADYAEIEAAKIIERALDLGVNLIDTAESYAWGQSERMVGRAVRHRRADAFIATKFSPVAPFPPIVALQAWGSRRRLEVEMIDLYQIHRPNRHVPLAIQVADLRSLVDAGAVRHIGVSNYPLVWWQAAERAFGPRSFRTRWPIA
jgi:aryl-alcohol dehydrogenase-like predicted oxidoreductase